MCLLNPQYNDKLCDTDCESVCSPQQYIVPKMVDDVKDTILQKKDDIHKLVFEYVRYSQVIPEDQDIEDVDSPQLTYQSNMKRIGDMVSSLYLDDDTLCDYTNIEHCYETLLECICRFKYRHWVKEI